MPVFALFAGILAALASVFGKLSGESFLENVWLNRAVQTCCLLLMVSLNAGMWTFYVKALQSSSAFEATVVSCATNYLLASIFGVAMFGEITGHFFWIGISLILCGIYLINSSPAKEKSSS